MLSSGQLQYDCFLVPGCQCQSISCSLVATTILSCLAFLFLFCSPGLAQSAQALDHLHGQINRPESPSPSPNASAQFREQPDSTVTGRVVDQTGNGVAGADVKLLGDREILMGEVQTDDDGQFAFAHVSPGPLQFSIVAEGFTAQTVAGTLRSGENQVFPPIHMSLAPLVTEIRVTPFTEEIAQEQFKEQERQRVFGIVPNFYVTYVNDAVPLSARQKFQLALKSSTDPVTVVAVAAIAGVDQAANRFSGYGQGAQGYTKRYAASYGNLASGLFIGGAVLPSILKQDPRYFYNGTGTKRSRLLYAISRTVICKGDNQRWQPNYSSIFGDLAAGGISNLYIPERDRHGARLTFENAGIALATSAAINVLQEFVLRRVTSKRRTSN
ncbi:MAG TPA: carboxypeptidase-like regulatory domain-containing protein [Candidatus Eisenbacteria bacterium]|nr:carboxypeptidase-like regulatory domain-containing protein [Candidatus Eisenbacteria bacterium]